MGGEIPDIPRVPYPTPLTGFFSCNARVRAAAASVGEGTLFLMSGGREASHLEVCPTEGKRGGGEVAEMFLSSRPPTSLSKCVSTVRKGFFQRGEATTTHAEICLF